MRAVRKIAAASVVAAFALAGCSSGGTSTESVEETTESGAATQSGEELTTIVVGASPSPHGKILQFVQDNLAAENGLNIEIVEYTDYVEPNKALAAGQLDANWFQHIPYLEEHTAQEGWTFEHGEGTHLEPLGLFSDKYDAVSEKTENASIGIINDPTNQARALKLLADEGFVELPASGDVNAATVTLLNGTTLVEVDGPALVRNLQDLDFAVINGNFAQEGGLTLDHAVALESTEDNPYVNVVAWLPGSDNEEAVKKLDALLHSAEVQQYIEETWPDKSVIPAK